MASASHPPAHPALQPPDWLILLPHPPPAAVEISIGSRPYPAKCTHSDAFVQPSLRARPGRANSDSFVHISAVERSGLGHLVEGQRVSYQLERGQQGKTSAIDLKAA